MRLFGLDISRANGTALVAHPVDAEFLEHKAATLTIDQILTRLETAQQTLAGITVTPENCMESPTVHGIVTVISRTIANLSLDVYQRSVTSDGRVRKEVIPNHPVAKLLGAPNEWLSKTEYWLDATSFLLRYGRAFSFKARGQTGPIRRLIPIVPNSVEIVQDENLTVSYRVHKASGEIEDYRADEIHYSRGAARDGLRGDSPVIDCRDAIAAEIAAQRFGGSFFGNGAMPGLLLKFAEGFGSFKTDEEKTRFTEAFNQTFRAGGRFKVAMLPKGVELDQQVGVEPDKAQFIETRKHLRNVICGAWGVPPYIAGDLERQTFNNAEQQSINKTVEVTAPICRIFESAMERDLLTIDDRRQGVMIRFNIDAGLRGDFKTRQEGLRLMRENGVINPNEWRAFENMNARAGGDDYWEQGPQGQAAEPSGPKPEGDSNAEAGQE